MPQKRRTPDTAGRHGTVRDSEKSSPRHEKTFADYVFADDEGNRGKTADSKNGLTFADLVFAEEGERKELLRQTQQRAGGAHTKPSQIVPMTGRAAVVGMAVLGAYCFMPMLPSDSGPSEGTPIQEFQTSMGRTFGMKEEERQDLPAEPAAAPSAEETPEPVAVLPELTAEPIMEQPRKPTATAKPTATPEATAATPAETPAASGAAPTAVPPSIPSATAEMAVLQPPIPKPEEGLSDDAAFGQAELPAATTQEPTEEPTAAPTEEPTAAPTEEPTAAPTEEPTAAPTEEPTAAPTEEPTAAPTEEPTAAPTEEPTAAPTEEPTVVPTPPQEPLPSVRPFPTAIPVLPTPLPSLEMPVLIPEPTPTPSYATDLVLSGLGNAPCVKAYNGWDDSLKEYAFRMADSYGVSYEMVLAIAYHESHFTAGATHINTNGTTDWGMMQCNDVCLPLLSRRLGISSMTELLDPKLSIQAGCVILSYHMERYGNENDALLAYQVGEGTYARYKASGTYPAVYGETIALKQSFLAAGI